MLMKIFIIKSYGRAFDAIFSDGESPISIFARFLLISFAINFSSEIALAEQNKNLFNKYNIDLFSPIIVDGDNDIIKLKCGDFIKIYSDMMESNLKDKGKTTDFYLAGVWLHGFMSGYFHPSFDGEFKDFYKSGSMDVVVADCRKQPDHLLRDVFGDFLKEVSRKIEEKREEKLNK
jgi:hypothetical protein